ncbi:MAG: DUF937 domain-containing protein [Bacteroidota bacterium]|jgi:uncharacterized protein YidB (DUF937 family)|nr:MAG: hypothetical protein DIU61_01190 [Bacteroidota bacterium]
MIDQLKKLVENYAGDAVIRNSEVPDEKNAEAIEAISSGIEEGLQNEVRQGKYEEFLSMFQQGGQSLSANPAVSGIMNNVVGNLSSRLGLSPQVSQSIAASLIPMVMNGLVSKTNDPNDSDFDLQDMLRSFSGKEGLNVSELLGKFTGGSKAGGGVGDMLGKMFGSK